MVIFHSYVSLPEGTLVFNPQAVPPSSNVPSVSSFTAFSCCGAASSSPKARNHSAEVRWFSSAASRRVLVANMASAPTPARPWGWRGPKGPQGVPRGPKGMAGFVGNLYSCDHYLGCSDEGLLQLRQPNLTHYPFPKQLLSKSLLCPRCFPFKSHEDPWWCLHCQNMTCHPIAKHLDQGFAMFP